MHYPSVILLSIQSTKQELTSVSPKNLTIPVFPVPTITVDPMAMLAMVVASQSEVFV